VLLADQIGFLRSRGIRVTTVSAPEPHRSSDGPLFPDYSVSMSRVPAPVSDALAVLRVWMLLLEERPDIVHTHTPKAGLLGMLAAYAAGIPVRIMTVNGLVDATAGRWKKLLLWYSDRLSCSLATRVLCVSSAIRETIVAERRVPADKTFLLGNGSSHGVDTDKFSPARRTPKLRQSVRGSFGLPADKPVVGYVGRLVRDKGVEVLSAAWEIVSSKAHAYLLLCGEFEESETEWRTIPEGDLLRTRPFESVRHSRRTRCPFLQPSISACYQVSGKVFQMSFWRPGRWNSR